MTPSPNAIHASTSAIQELYNEPNRPQIASVQQKLLQFLWVTMYFLTILPICDLIAPTQWRRQAPTVCIRTRMPASCWFQRVYAVKLVVLYCLDSTSKNILGFSILPKFVDFCRCTFSVFMGVLSRRLPSKILHFPYICGVVSRRKT